MNTFIFLLVLCLLYIVLLIIVANLFEQAKSTTVSIVAMMITLPIMILLAYLNII